MADLKQLQQKKRDLARMLREAEKLSGQTGAGQRQRDAERKRVARQVAKDIASRQPKNPARRTACEADVYLFLATYFPNEFTQSFTPQRRQMVDSILSTATHGGCQALAASRGEGKSTIARCVTIYCVLTGLRRFPVIAAANGRDAQRILRNIKKVFERPLDYPALHEDYPETDCITYLRGRPQGASGQTVDGQETFLCWNADRVSFPHYPGAKSSGANIETRGLDAALRGIVEGTDRPDLVLIDDPETRESASSEQQRDTRRLLIEEDLSGLAGPGKSLAMVMLTTLMTESCLSAEFTDPTKKPAWIGKRFRFVEKWSDRMDLADEYTSLWQEDLRSGDRMARKAHAFYLENRKLIEQGVEVANSERFISRTLPGGTQQEVSAFQHALNIIAGVGREHFDTEYQNDPPEESAPEESGITAHRIQKQVSGFARKQIPPGCSVLTMGVDVRKVALHWVVRAWETDAARKLLKGYTIDYGVTEVYGTEVGNDEGLDNALVRALHARRDVLESEPYCRSDGSVVPVELSLVDAGWRTEAIYRFCREAGLAWKPSMGFGKSAGCTQASFTQPVHPSADKKLGDRWFMSRRPNGTWLVCMDTDHWKAWEHDRWMTPPDKPGSMLLFGAEQDRQDPHYRPDRLSNDQKGHFSYAKHLTAEVEVEEVVKGRLKRYWKPRSDNNHYLDASYMADVAASMCGVGLLGNVGKPRRDPSARPSAAQLAGAG
jgi:hypothetical protein